MVGIEPTTYALRMHCSTRLSYIGTLLVYSKMATRAISKEKPPTIIEGGDIYV